MSSYSLGRTHALDYARNLSTEDAMRYLRLYIDDAPAQMRVRKRKYAAGYVDALLEHATN